MAGKFKTRALEPEFFEAFKNGNLNNLLTVIKNDPNLIMCLRGNYTTVYYRGLQILKINQDFSFEVDGNYGIEENFFKNNSAVLWYKKCNPCYCFKVNILEFDWVQYFKDIKYLMDEHCRKNQDKLEKEIQQIMFRENSCNSIADETDYFLFDLEYAHKQARFDAIAIFWPRKDRAFGKKTQLAIIELKAGLNAIKGNAGLTKHYIDVKNFLESIDKETFLNDMKEVFSQMKNLGLINTKANPDKLSIDKNEIQFIFAMANYNDNSVILQPEIEKMEVDRNSSFKTYFVKSPFLGYGLYEKCMVSIEEYC